MPNIRALGCKACTLVVVLLGLGVAAFLSTPNAMALPTGWGYELVSQPDALGNDINFGLGSPDGEHAWVSVLTPVSSKQSTGNVVVYAAHRTRDGWLLHDLGKAGNDRYALAAYAADGARTLTSICNNILLGCLTGRFSLERVDDGGNRLTMLDMPYTYPSLETVVSGTSDDLSRVVFRSPIGLPPLTSDDTHSSGRGLYESTDGMLQYIGYDENADILSCGVVLADNQASVNNGNGTGFEQSGVSADGRTIVFESPDADSGCSNPADVYVRHNGTSLNISRPHDGGLDTDSQFAGASRDGQRVYFTTHNKLVSADTDAVLDLYVYNSLTSSYKRLSAGVGVKLRHVAVSPDGDYVYFESDQSF